MFGLQDPRVVRDRVSGIDVTAHPKVISFLTTGRIDDEFMRTVPGPIAIGVSLSRPTRGDLENEGYSVLAEIGNPQQMSPDEFPSIATRVASIILKLLKIVRKDAYIALSCPNALAFMIGCLIGRRQRIHVLHYEENRYRRLPDFKPERVKTPKT